MDEKLIINVRKPKGDLGSQLLDRMNKSHEEMAKWGVSHFNVKVDDSVLDIGCGGGVNVQRFSNIVKEGKSYGIDYSDVSVKKSTKLNQEAIDKGIVEIKQGSVSNLPYFDETFNIVTAFETVYFWPDFVSDLKEVNRVLKKNGLIFICNEAVHTEDNIEKYKDIVELLDMNIYSEEVLKSSLEEAGFKDFKAFRKEGQDWICVLAYKR